VNRLAAVAAIAPNQGKSPDQATVPGFLAW
jgi:hypothetical protein